ncbi:plasmid partition protein ParG [Rhodopseudomonas parapalustris]
MSKTVAFKMPAPARTQGADAWIENGVEPHLKKEEPAPAAAAQPVAMKRFTIDVPVELHTRIKIACVQRGRVMADEIRRLLEDEFPAKS